MSSIMASTAGRLTPMHFPDVTYEAHMSCIHEHAILIDTECAVVNAEKRQVQAIQKAEHDHLEVNSSNSTASCGNSGCAGGQGGNSSSHITDQGRGHGGRG